MKTKSTLLPASILSGTLLLIALSASADLYRWEFSGTLDRTSGTGSRLPGVVPGASFTGYVLLNTSDLFWYFHGPYDVWRDDSAYRSPSATVSYTVTYAGNSYTYGATGIQFGVAQGTAAYGKDIVSIASYDYSFSLWNKTPSPISRITDTSFASFVSGMTTELAGSDSSFALLGSDGYNNGATCSLLTSLGPVPVPEPNTVALLCLALGSVLTWRRRQT